MKANKTYRTVGELVERRRRDNSLSNCRTPCRKGEDHIRKSHCVYWTRETTFDEYELYEKANRRGE
jgi:hypothetical protein